MIWEPALQDGHMHHIDQYVRPVCLSGTFHVIFPSNQRRENFMNITISRANLQEKRIIENLVALYLHDLSEFTDGLDPNNEGLFEYDGIELYWEKESLIPLLIKVDEEVVGFVFLNRPPYAPKEVDFMVNEFFILKKFQRKGIGEQVMRKVFAAYPGRYMVVQIQANIPAVKFWRKLYENNRIPYTELVHKMEGEICLTQNFAV